MRASNDCKEQVRNVIPDVWFLLTNSVLSVNSVSKLSDIQNKSF